MPYDGAYWNKWSSTKRDSEFIGPMRLLDFVALNSFHALYHERVRSSLPEVFLEISQDSQENTCARDSVLINFIKKESLVQVFSSEYCEFLRIPFLQNTVGGCFWRVRLSSQQKLQLPFLQEMGSPCLIYFCITSFLFYFSSFSSSFPFFYFYVIFPIGCKSQLCPCDFDKWNSFNLGKRNYLPQCFSVGFAYENLFVD